MQREVPAHAVLKPVSVSALNGMARAAIEAHISPLWVAGEISNFTRAASGHCYFVLKDTQAQVRCTLFRHRAQSLKALPANGDQVEVLAVPSLYEARGEFQLNVEQLRLGGLGRLFEAFERLKNRLRAEGLFEPGRKRGLPVFPRRVGVVTSPSGAALRDVLTTLRRRMSAIEVIVYPTLVQGEGAARGIVDALGQAARRAECDVLLLCRGGGSIEDLWAFNEEIVARAIVASPIPVVTGIGHETDFTIADFAADLRAPTPTGAAELASPDRAQWLRRCADLRQRWHRAAARAVENRAQRLDGLARRLVHPGEQLRQRARGLALLRDRWQRAARQNLDRACWRLGDMLAQWRGAGPETVQARERLRALRAALATHMMRRFYALSAGVARLGGKFEALDPRRVLERGYAIVRDRDGAVVADATRLRTGDALEIAFARGEVRARVEGDSDAS